MAFCKLSGIAFIMLFLIFVMVMNIFNNPHMNTRANACSQVKPRAKTTVYVKNALSPMPGACA